MFERVEAVRFDRKMSNGRTSPLLLECERDDGSTVEVVAKFSAGCSAGGLIREAIVAMLASDLELPVPAPYLVELSPAFIDGIPDATVASALRKSDVFGFGSQRLPDGFRVWVEPGGRMSDSLEQEALDIMALDCWLTNADRRVANPNLLTDGKQFAIFDHELALLGPTILFWQEPWLADALLGKKPPDDHVFFTHLRRRAAYSFATMLQRLGSLPDSRIDSYLAALPPSWTSASTEDVAGTAGAYLKALRDNSAGADAELKKALA